MRLKTAALRSIILLVFRYRFKVRFGLKVKFVGKSNARMVRVDDPCSSSAVAPDTHLPDKLQQVTVDLNLQLSNVILEVFVKNWPTVGV